jgi:hypothetical protein
LETTLSLKASGQEIKPTNKSQLRPNACKEDQNHDYIYACIVKVKIQYPKAACSNIINKEIGFETNLDKHEELTESKVHKNNNPKEKRRICCGLNPNAFHVASPPATPASCRVLSIAPRVPSTGDKSDLVSIPFSFNSSKV